MSKKKVLSIVLAASMVASMAAVTAVSTSADDNIRGTLYFDANGPLAGANRNTYYCYAWGSDGTGAIAEWNTKSLKMTKVEGEDTLYSYNMPKTNEAGDPVNADLIIFSALGVGQTYDTTFSDSCFGDTAYVLEEVLENPVDSAQTCYAAAWRNNPQEGAHISITSTGKVQGVGILSTETPESITDAFIEQYNAGMAEGKTGYDNPALVTDEARASYIAQIEEIIASQPERPTADPDATEPTTATTATEATQATQATEATDPTAPTEDSTQAVVEDPYGRLAGLPLPEDMNVPAKDADPTATYSNWDGYYNVFYFEAPEEWITEHVDAKEKNEDGETWDIGFYWYTGEINNGEWPGVEAQKLSVLDENGNDIYADSNIYYGFAPTFAGSIIWNNGISDAVAENKQYKLQTADIKVDDPALNSLADIVYEESNQEIDGVSVAGCLSYVSSVDTVVNGLTGDEMDVYNCSWKFFNPRTGETTTKALKDANGEYVTVSGEAYGYALLALNPYFDMDYDHVNEGGEQATAAPIATLPVSSTDASQQTATSATNATTKTTTTTTTKGTVNTAEGAAVVVLATVLTAAFGVAFVARKRRESEEA